MTLETFFEKFELFADAPDAVAKMRVLILESAIRGNLVPQDSIVAPASELLRQIEAQSSIQAAKGRNQPALPPVGDDAYLPVPQGWEWTRLGKTGRIFNGDSVSESGKAELAKVDDGLPFIATKDVGYGRGTLVYENGLKVPHGDPRFKVARKNAVLICAEGGSAGRKIGITDRDICFGNKLIANEVWEGIHHRYIFYFYQAPTFYREFASRMTGIIGGIARSEFLSLPIPIPPEEEQKRIVAKVDELMALCDRLEAQQEEREAKHATLARASLARFSDAPTPANLDLLFHKSYSISPTDLRKSILTLAVQGKLVPQDPNDEPAAELLGKMHGQSRDRFEMNDDLSTYHTIPSSWIWTALGNYAECSRGRFSIRPRNDPTCYNGPYPFIQIRDLSEKGGLIDSHSQTLNEKGLSVSKIFKAGTLVVAIVGATIGNTGILAYDMCFPDSLVGLETGDPIGNRYTEVFLLASVQRIRELSYSGGGQPNIKLSILNPLPFPLPPLAEQRRIVAKVDELMALVDALETQLAASRATAEKLMESVVAELTTQD